MRWPREITAEEENFRVVPHPESNGSTQVIRRDPVKPEPEGTIVLLAYRITGYDRDCDGSLMARLEQISIHDGTPTGCSLQRMGIYKGDLIVTQKEVKRLAEMAYEKKMID